MNKPVAVTVTAALLLAGCGSSTHVRINGGPLGDMQAGHAAAVTEMHTVAAARGGVVADDGSCWLAAPPAVEGQINATGEFLCGPVLLPGSNPDRFYMTFRATFQADTPDADGDRTQHVVGIEDPDPEPNLVALNDDWEYLHPNDVQIPTATDLDVPSFPPGDPDLIATDLAADPSGETVEGVIRGAEQDVSVDMLGTVAAVTTTDGATVGPADGHELVAIQTDRTIALADGRELPAYDGPIAVSVPEGEPFEVVWTETIGGEPALGGATPEHELEHRWDVRAGEPVDPYVGLYREDGLEIETWTGEVPCEYTPAATSTDEPCTEEVRVNYELILSIERKDRMFLEVNVDPMHEEGTLTLTIDGEQVDRVEDTAARWLFDIPADFEQGQVTFNTGGEYDGDGWDSMWTGLDHTLEFTTTPEE